MLRVESMVVLSFSVDTDDDGKRFFKKVKAYHFALPEGDNDSKFAELVCLFYTLFEGTYFSYYLSFIHYLVAVLILLLSNQ